MASWRREEVEFSLEFYFARRQEVAAGSRLSAPPSCCWPVIGRSLAVLLRLDPGTGSVFLPP